MAPCPCCGGSLKVIGSRPRKYIQDTGLQKTIIIRRLQCENCHKIHHELPDILIPYKRYEASCFEKVVSLPHENDVAADNSTLFRWNCWFLGMINYWLACLRSIALRFQLDLTPMNLASTDSLTILKCLGRIFGNASGWLSRMNKPIVNVNLWVQTRSALLSS
ncbi:hypothetical protein EWI07_07385 [Sporolactobacillus sp. THM7-4]|nr:hypothetical protein EWI07_07385 [Sporolactobacillus sp. THM7-4]